MLTLKRVVRCLERFNLYHFLVVTVLIFSHANLCAHVVSYFGTKKIKT